VLEAALELFDEVGYRAATIEGIGRRSDVSVGSIYHHFASKEKIAGALYVQALGDFQRGLAQALADNPDAEDGVRAAVHHHLRWVDADHARARLLMRRREAEVVHMNQAGIDLMNREIFSTIREWHRPLVDLGAIRDLPMPLLYSIWFGPAQEHARVLLDRESRPPDLLDAAPALADAAWAALRSSR
jgi:AcrR family transcriptional regulator